jgi:hypothetical protein
MAVLVEAISVIIRRDAIELRFAGGWAAFERGIPNGTSCMDSELVRVGFMTPADVGAYVSTLEAGGLVFERDGQAVDLAVLDQLHGLTVPAPWLETGTIQTGKMKVAACWAAGQRPEELEVPAGWRYEDSISQKPGFVPMGTEGDLVKFLRREKGLDIYLDLVTGREVFMGRPAVEGDGEAALFTRLETIFHEVLKLEAEMQPLASLGDKEGLAPLIRRLNVEFLSEVEKIADGPGCGLSFVHFTRGLILRILLRREEAEQAFRKANALRPSFINTLLELVRCLGEQGKHQEALPFAREATEVAPVDAGAWGNLAMCLIQCGERDEARKVIDFAIGLDPQDPVNRMILDNFEKYFE